MGRIRERVRKGGDKGGVNPTAVSIVELNKNLAEPLIKRLYPHIHVLMKRRLCVTATTVPSERIFSKAGMTITARRSSLKPNKDSQALLLVLF